MASLSDSVFKDGDDIKTQAIIHYEMSDETNAPTINAQQTQENVRRSERTRTLTDKGKMHNLYMKKGQCDSASTKILRKRCEISNLMLRHADDESFSKVKTTLTQLNDLFHQWKQHFVNYYEELSTQEERDSENKLYQEKEVSVLNFIKKTEKWIKDNEKTVCDQMSSVSQQPSRASKCHSRASSKSLSTSMKLDHAKEKAKLAELQIQRQMTEETKRLKELQLDIEIAKVKARERVYAEMESEMEILSESLVTWDEDEQGTGDQKQGVHFGEKMYMLNPDACNFSPKRFSSVLQQSRLQDENTNIPANEKCGANVPVSDFGLHVPEVQVPTSDFQANQFSNVHVPVTEFDTHVRHDHRPSGNMPINNFVVPDYRDVFYPTMMPNRALMPLPQPEIPKFHGDPISFNSFIMAFDARIVPNSTNDLDRLYYLDQHLVGEPKSLIAGCMYMEPSEGYRKARDILLKEYGDPYKISTAYINQVLSWPEIKYEENNKLKQFSVLLTKCFYAMKSMSYMTVLNHAPNMQAIIRKLPTYLQNKWRDHVTRCREQNNRIVNFEDIVNFIDFAAKSANEPVFNREAMMDRYSFGKVQSKVSSRDRKFLQLKTSAFVTGVNFSSDSQQRRTSCFVCKKNHVVDDCPVFSSKTLTDKRQFLRERSMCFGCYGSHHVAKGCLRKRTCKKCGKRHPTALHDDDFHVQQSQVGLGQLGKNIHKLH